MICQAGQLLGFRSVSYLLGFLRSFMLTVSIVLFVGVILAVSEKFPRIAWIAVLLAVAVTVRDFRRGRGSSSHEGRQSHDVEGSGAPAWMDHARWYYSEIGGEESADPVCVFDASDREEVNRESPGTLFLQLEPRYLASPRVRVLDAGGREQGFIRSEGLLPCLRYAMRRDGELVWMLSGRSIVRKRHVLVLANGDSWTFHTPFFWWQNLSGTTSGALGLFGGNGPTKRYWLVWIEPGKDSFDLLAAVAFLHRQYWHW